MPVLDTSIILAAGRGQRMKELSLIQPKPMTAVNDMPIIDNLVSKLIRNGMKNIVVVIGYMAEKLKTHIEKKFDQKTNLIFVENDIFDKTNNIYSLWLAREYMRRGFYLFEADVFCDEIIIRDLLTHAADNIILIDQFVAPMNGTVVTLTPESIVEKMILKKEQGSDFDYAQSFKTLNFYKIDHNFVTTFFEEKLNEHIQNKNVNSFYEQIFKEAIEKGFRFLGLKTSGIPWWEIDTYEDLQIAEKMFKK